MDDTERCVCCGSEIPEGRQVCMNCESGYTSYNSGYKTSHRSFTDIIRNICKKFRHKK